MKNLLYTFIALVILNVSAKANGFRSKLNIRTFNDRSIIVEIDRINYNNPSREIIITDLAPGDHKIKIWTVGGQYHNYGHNTRNFRLVYNGFINIPARSKVKAVLTYQNILKVTDIDPLQINYHQECNNTIVQSGYGYCGNYYGNYYTNNNYHNNRFEELKDLVASESFDDTRLAICKEYIRTHSINSNELRELLGLITFESNRINLAKYSYRYVSDPGYFYTVYNAFTFDSSVNELINWINHQS
jgi:hypothetical protein